jgi:nucleoside-diphosphate-sugar epimerase
VPLPAGARIVRLLPGLGDANWTTLPPTMTGVFVTGGSGFIGGRLIERLRADGHAVRALARSSPAAERVHACGAEPIEGDLADVAAMRAGAKGCELAFHAAAMLGDWGKREDFERVNVDGTRNALRGCAEAGVRRFTHVGTEAALLAGEPLIAVNETAPLRPDSPSLYCATKARAEQAVVSANADGFETVVVRPRFVWGVGDTTLLPSVVELVRSGRFAWIGGGRHRTSITHVENVVEGLLLGATRGRPGTVYFVTDGEPVVFREFVTELLATQGVSAPSRSIPTPAASVLARTGEEAWRLLRLSGRPPLTRLAYWISGQECTIRIDRAREQLGYAPAKTIADGLAELRAASVPVAL